MDEASEDVRVSCPKPSGMRVLVVGLGRFGGGVGVTRWLVSQGAVVTVTDRAGADDLVDSLKEIADMDVVLRLGGHDPAYLRDTDLVVLNPAVDKRTSEFFQEIVRRKIPWTTETNLFCQRCRAHVIAVTGSYGKSTTCAMLAHVLQRRAGRAGVDYDGVHLGGNIGRSLLGDLPEIRPSDLVVLEMSNAQLEDLPKIEWAPAFAVVTNILPHHMDRYDSYEEYLTAKFNIFGTSRKADAAIVGPLDSKGEAMLARVTRARDLSVPRVGSLSCPVELRVPGEHNQANAACVLAVCEHFGIAEEAARDALRSFKGLPHRLDRVRTLDGVDYYDDSKATSPGATVRAVESFDRPIIAIVGGQEKRVSLVEWARAMTRACRAVICVGQSGPTFAAALRSCAKDTCCDDTVIESDGLEPAVERARSIARPGDLVLFSPGAPSFDQYANFTARGRHFATIVNGR